MLKVSEYFPTCLCGCHNPSVGSKSNAPETEAKSGDNEDCHDGHSTGHLVVDDGHIDSINWLTL